MIVFWKPNRILTIPCVKLGKTIRLMPGNNEVTDVDWADAKTQVKDKLAGGDIKEVVALVVDKETKAVKSKSIGDLPVKEAAAIVKDTNDLVTLEKWLKEESRDSIRAGIMNQIKKINKAGERKKDKDEDKEDAADDE